ncbi:hypothetical protein HRR80_001504 [Exophiala dermatitidis]|uniref:Uncharacterized protein n=1 Tax=Exophiala dermatitidis TaxID=5970 RepID=A0AAN6F1P7_EXODE|nr:hypothetical protein HRR79_002621 [Exophiala dermatitidis]KAJ4698850.1 hypothetical protein HRR87_000407 [Exophiala dermatitidis]KAJ8994804.1 hypothetical protein HRR80_001504 [Exophiala dermatitidis]
MLEAYYYLGESSHLHRKSGICLRTRTTIEVSFEDDCQAPSLHARDANQLSQHWFPRAMVICLSLHALFADDLVLTPLTSKDANNIIADHIESADLWKQLGYEASLESPKDDNDSLDLELRVWRVLFAANVADVAQSQKHNGSATFCPTDVSPCHLRAIQLHLRFMGSSGTGEKLGVGLDGCRSGNEPEGKEHSQYARPQACDSEVVGSNFLRCQNEKSGEITPLDGTILVALLDAGFRTSICSKPIRMAPGVKSLSEQDMLRLCEIVPNSFAPDYIHRFEEQAKYIPGISGFLASFLRNATSKGEEPPLGVKGTSLANALEVEAADNSASVIDRDLWMTVAGGVHNYEHSRRLRPLWSSKPAADSHKVLDDRDPVRRSAASVGGDLLPEIADLDLHKDSGTGTIEEDDLFGFAAAYASQAEPYEHAEQTTGFGNAESHSEILSDFPDAGATSRQMLSNTHEFSRDLKHSVAIDVQNRSRMRSASHTSDVSMLTTHGEPIKEAAVIDQSPVIGSLSWLTQDLIRVHPLRKHEEEKYLADRSDLQASGQHVSGRDEPCWFSENLLDESIFQPDELGLQHTAVRRDAAFSSSSEGDRHLLTDSPDTPYSSDNSSSNTSIIDLPEDEHLLLHMETRPCKVEPGGAKDSHELKPYEVDHDMKFLASAWGMDPIDSSPVSDDHQILQEMPDDPLPREQTMSPPMSKSGKRLNFSLGRSSSSSSSIGRSVSDARIQRRPSLLKRFSWGGRGHAGEGGDFDMTTLDGRTMEVKRRKTLDDYEMTETDVRDDESSDMLF